MKPERKYLGHKAFVNMDGSCKTKQQKHNDYKMAAVGKLEPIPEPHPAHVKKFHEFLNGYQEDINKIVGKFRWDFHHLDHAEVVSEVNLSFIKKRDELINKFDGDFTVGPFRALAYTFVRNVIKWTHSRINNNSYHKRRENAQFVTEDGPKTSYELAIHNTGEEEEFYEDFDRNSKCKYLLKMVRDYSGILTDAEVKVLAFLEKGMTQYEIGEKLGVTHQAISINTINIYEKIRAHFSYDAVQDNSFDDVSKGHKSIEGYFSRKSGKSPIVSEDRGPLKQFLLSNAKRCSSVEFSEKFLNGKYNPRQIASFCVKNKLGFCLIKKAQPAYSNAESNELLSLFKKGHSVHEVAKAMGRSPKSVLGKRAHFVSQGLLESLVESLVES